MPRELVVENVLNVGLYSAPGGFLPDSAADRAAPSDACSINSVAFEYEEILTRDKDLLGLSAADVEDVLDGLCSRGENRGIREIREAAGPRGLIVSTSDDGPGHAARKPARLSGGRHKVRRVEVV